MRLAGKKVVDTKGKRRLVITKGDIARGKVKDPDGCAAAIALEREPGVQQAKVHLSRVYLKEGDKWVRYLTPKSLRDEIVAFDRGGKFEPGAHMLLPVQSTAHLGSKRPQYEATGKFPQKAARSKPHLISGVRPNGHTGSKHSSKNRD